MAAQCHRNVRLIRNAGEAPISLYLLSVVGSGDRKTSADRKAMAAIFRRQQALDREYVDKVREYEAAAAAYGMRRQKALKAAIEGDEESASDPGAIKRVLAGLGQEPLRPLEAKLVVNDPTPEGLFRDFALGQPGMVFALDEAGIFLSGQSMRSEGLQRTLATFNKLWDAGFLSRSRMGTAEERARKSPAFVPSVIRGRRLSMHLMGQPLVMARLLADAQAKDLGFLARCLVAWPESLAGTRLSKPTPEQIARWNNTLDDLAYLLLRVLERPLPIDPEATTENQLKPEVLELDPGAEQLLDDFYVFTETSQAPEGLFARIRPFASKAHEHAARLAGVLTVVTDPDATSVSEDMMLRAIRLVTWYLNEALRLIAPTVADPALDGAQELKAWAEKRPANAEPLSEREIANSGPRRFRRNVVERRNAIEALVRRG
jgi:hypothetical protein